MNARNERPANGAGRKKAVARVGVGSAALASAGLALLAAQGSAPAAAAHTEHAGVQPATLTASLGGLPPAPGGTGQAAGDAANLTPAPAPPIQVAPAPQREGTATFSGGAGVSLPFSPDGGFGLANFFGLLNVTPPPLGGLSTGGSLPLNFSSTGLSSLFNPPSSAPAGLSSASSGLPGSAPLPSIFDLDPAYNGLVNAISKQQNDAAVQDAADQVDRNLQLIDSIPFGQPTSMNTDLPADTGAPAGSGVQVATSDPLQAFQLAAAGDVQLAQNSQSAGPSVTLTYPDGSSQTFPLPPAGGNPVQLFAPLGSTITLPSGNVQPLNDPGLLMVVPPAGSGTSPVPVQVLPMDKIPMADGTGGTTTVADATPPTTKTVTDDAPPAPVTDTAPPPAPAPVTDTAPPAPAPATDTAPPAPAPVTDTAPPAPAPATDTAPPAPAPVDDTAPPAPVTDPAPAPDPAPVVAFDVPTGGSFGGSGSA